MLPWFIERIKAQCPMTVAEYMEHCLYHPDFGYYTTGNPLGVDSDFLTAPETSQMFGEMIALCCQELWMRMGSPRVHVVEVGPGQGALMQDFLRIIPAAFRDSMELHMVDVSPVLRQEQQKRIQHPGACWHDSMEFAFAQCKGPTFIIANELFDALPIHQNVKTTDGWQERVVTLSSDEQSLVFSPAEGSSIKESCPLAAVYMEQICQHLSHHEGLALLIDYGYVGPAYGDTLQALHRHTFHDVLETPGKADITAHVDFGALMAAAKGVSISGPTTQGDFLSELGIGLRAEMLKNNATPGQQEQISRALHRLIDNSQMGELFKVMAVRGPQTPQPLGFSRCLKAASSAR